jgi:hypothetical protein
MKLMLGFNKYVNLSYEDTEILKWWIDHRYKDVWYDDLRTKKAIFLECKEKRKYWSKNVVDIIQMLMLGRYYDYKEKERKFALSRDKKEYKRLKRKFKGK